MSECCLKGFRWEGVPKGHEAELAGNKTYVTGTSSEAAVIIIHDLFGWTFPNTRLLADHYAEEAGVTVYIPDFFGGEVLSFDIINDPTRWAELNLPDFTSRNNKIAREKEVIDCAKALRAQYKRTGAVGFCFGGPLVFRLGAAGLNLVDCGTAHHPTFLEKAEIDNISVPIQIIAPEIDPQYTEELKAYSNEKIPTFNLPYDYQFFPGLEHGFATRGDPKNPAEQKGMERAKNATVLWLRQWLLDTA